MSGGLKLWAQWSGTALIGINFLASVQACQVLSDGLGAGLRRRFQPEGGRRGEVSYIVPRSGDIDLK
jgi:hypothetical protein